MRAIDPRFAIVLFAVATTCCSAGGLFGFLKKKNDKKPDLELLPAPQSDQFLALPAAASNPNQQSPFSQGGPTQSGQQLSLPAPQSSQTLSLPAPPSQVQDQTELFREFQEWKKTQGQQPQQELPLVKHEPVKPASQSLYPTQQTPASQSLYAKPRLPAPPQPPQSPFNAPPQPPQSPFNAPLQLPAPPASRPPNKPSWSPFPEVSLNHPKPEQPLPIVPVQPRPFAPSSMEPKKDFVPRPKFFEPPQFHKEPSGLALPAPGQPKKPPTREELNRAYKELFVWSDGLSRERVLENVDTLNRFEGTFPSGKMEIPLDKLAIYSNPSVENCQDSQLLQSWHKLVNDITYEHKWKSLEKVAKEGFEQQKKLCDFGGRATEAFENFKQDEEMWETLKLWNHKVGHYGKRHTKWGASDHSTNDIQMNEALREMVEEHGGDSFAKYQFGYRMVTTLREYCSRMQQLKGVLGMTKLEKNWKQDREVKEYHKMMSVCVQTANVDWRRTLEPYLG